MPPKQVKTSKSSNASTMEELLAKSGYNIKGFSRGEKVKAKLIEMGAHSATFDVGGKGEGILIDTYFQEAKDFLRTLKPGDATTATVMDPETSDGSVLISLRQAASDSIWDFLNEAKKTGSALNVLVRNVTSSGILVEQDNLSGFIPTSQIGKATLTHIDDLNGKRIKVKVIEVDKKRKRVVFSEKAVSEAKDMELNQKAQKELKEGQIYTGTIVTVADFGVFVGIPVKVDDKKTTVEGLVHVSELSWEKTEKPSDSFKKGQKVDVKVLASRGGKLSLSVKQAQADPWEKEGGKYKVEDRIKGKVVKISDFGVFVQLEPGIEGLIHITKIPPAQHLKVGDEVQCYIEEINQKEKRISLGLVLTQKPLGYK